MRYGLFPLLILLLTGCAGLAMDAAKKGDRENMNRNLQYVSDPVEVNKIKQVYFDKACSDIASPSGPESLYQFGLCNFICAGTIHCDKPFGLKLILQSAAYGYEPARTFLTKADIKLPRIDPQLHGSWQLELDREQRQMEALSLSSSIQSLNTRRCVTEVVNNQLVETCN